MSWRHEVRQDSGAWSAVVSRKRKGGGYKVVATQGGFENEHAADAWGVANVEMRERDKAKSVQQAKHQEEDEEYTPQTDKLVSLAAELEALGDGIEVADGRYEGDGLFSLKVRTPTGAYLDCGTRREWMATIKGDLAAASKASCPFCSAPVPVAMDGGGGGTCGGCGAVHAYSGESLAHHLRIAESSPTQVLAALAGSLGCVMEDRRNNRVWGRRIGTFECDVPSPDLSVVTGPTSSAGTLALPLLLDTDFAYANPEAAKAGTLDELVSALSIEDTSCWEEAFAEGAVAVAGCGQCRFATSSEDLRGHVSGLYWGPGERTTFCTYPIDGSDAVPDNVRLDLEEQNARGYRTVETAHINNAMRKRVLDAFTCVDGPDDGLEALVPELGGTFHGPVCPAFELQPDGYWPDQGLYEATAVTVLATFGPVDFERRRREAARVLAAEARERRLGEARALVDELRRNPEFKALSVGTLNAQDARGVRADKIVDFLVRSVDVSFLMDSGYRDWFITMFGPSNKAKEIMRARIAQEIRGRGLVPEDLESSEMES